MARKPFVILDAEILSSTIWTESPSTKLVWLTMLILCDTEGYVGASLPGIANAAGVSVEDAEKALAVLQAPDKHSRTQKDEGRRIRPADRGWSIINFREHLERLSTERRRARERTRRWRERKRMGDASQADGDVTVCPGNREQRTGKSEESTDSKLASLPPVDQAERAIRDSKRALESKLLALVTAAGAADPQRRDPTQLIRLFTEYQRDGRKVGGVVNPALLTYERLEKSIADAEWWIARWKEGK